MKVKCKFIKGSDLFFLKNKSVNELSSEKHLTIGKEYIVYAITVHEEYIWYYLCDDRYSSYPIWDPSLFFEVIDPRLSRYWVYSFKKMEGYLSAQLCISFPQWALFHSEFYDKLTDWEKKEENIFKAYKNKMDLEFPDHTISIMAQVGDLNWLICPLCLDAWESSAEQDAMVICPYCHNIMHNPRYLNELPHL